MSVRLCKRLTPIESILLNFNDTAITYQKLKKKLHMNAANSHGKLRINDLHLLYGVQEALLADSLLQNIKMFQFGNLCLSTINGI